MRVTMAQRKKTRILIVDDEQEICELLSRYLVSDGYECATASSGEAALRLLETENFHLLIADIMMPGMSGMDLLNIVKTLFPDIAVVMVTAVDDRDTGILALELGAYGYIIKPFVRNEILINVANALERRRERLRASKHERETEEKIQELTGKRTQGRIPADEAVSCVRSGMDDAGLMKKFGLSATALRSLFDRLVADGELRHSEVDDRASLSPGSVALDITGAGLPAPRTEKPVISAKDAVASIRSGMDDLALMKKYKISARGLQSLFNKLVDLGKLSVEELYEHYRLRGNVVVVEDVHKLPRHYLALSAPIFEPTHPDVKGSLLDITEKGFEVIGIEAEVGEVKTLVIPTIGFVEPEHIWFDARCLWSKKQGPDGQPVAGFQITQWGYPVDSTDHNM